MRILASDPRSGLSRFAFVLSLAILSFLIAGWKRQNTSTFRLASTSDPRTSTSAPNSSAALPVASYAGVVSRSFANGDPHSRTFNHDAKRWGQELLSIRMDTF